MARNITFHAVGPVKIDPATLPKDDAGNPKKIFICACGLSKNFPYCDGTHKTTAATEEPGKIYRYTAEGRVEEV